MSFLLVPMWLVVVGAAWVGRGLLQCRVDKVDAFVDVGHSLRA
jgi:hypothetical protein